MIAWTEYISSTDLEDAIGEKTFVSLFDRGTGSPDVDAIDQVIRLSSALFESYAANKYNLDDLRITPPPDFASDMVLAIASYRAFKHNKRFQVPVEYKEEYLRVMEELRRWGPPIVAIGVETEFMDEIDAGLMDEADADLEGMAYVV